MFLAYIYSLDIFTLVFAVLAAPPRDAQQLRHTKNNNKSEEKSQQKRNNDTFGIVLLIIIYGIRTNLNYRVNGQEREGNQKSNNKFTISMWGLRTKHNKYITWTKHTLREINKDPIRLRLRNRCGIS